MCSIKLRKIIFFLNWTFKKRKCAHISVAFHNFGDRSDNAVEKVIGDVDEGTEKEHGGGRPGPEPTFPSPRCRASLLKIRSRTGVRRPLHELAVREPKSKVKRINSWSAVKGGAAASSSHRAAAVCTEEKAQRRCCRFQIETLQDRYLKEEFLWYSATLKPVACSLALSVHSLH